MKGNSFILNPQILSATKRPPILDASSLFGLCKNHSGRLLKMSLLSGRAVMEAGDRLNGQCGL